MLIKIICEHCLHNRQIGVSPFTFISAGVHSIQLIFTCKKCNTDSEVNIEIFNDEHDRVVYQTQHGKRYNIYG